MTDTADRVRQIIVGHFTKIRPVDAAAVVPDARLLEDLHADSLDLVEISFLLEDEFGREVSEDQAGSLVTVGDIITLIEGGR
jgi:acyl carrier protein